MNSSENSKTISYLDNIPSLCPNHKNIDHEKIIQYVLARFEIDMDNIMHDKIMINLSCKESGLTRDEMEIAKGIILANGHNYSEFCEFYDLLYR